jgi:protein TonB
MRLIQSFSAAILLSAIAAASAFGQEARKSISKPSPRYPEVAKRLNLVGTVKVEILIGSDGKIKNANVLGGHPIFANSTLDALKEWKYEPSKTETTVILTFEFHP